MKILKFIKNDLDIVRGREEVRNRLNSIYNSSKANLLYNFYCNIQLNGLNEVKNSISSSTYYRNIKLLKEAKIDFSQNYVLIDESNVFFFNPFTEKEVV